MGHSRNCRCNNTRSCYRSAVGLLELELDFSVKWECCERQCADTSWCSSSEEDVHMRVFLRAVEKEWLGWLYRFNSKIYTVLYRYWPGLDCSARSFTNEVL
jgi:hypothetical protein